MLSYQSLTRVQQECTGHAAGLPVKLLDPGTGTQQTCTATSLQEETERPELMSFSTSSH